MNNPSLLTTLHAYLYLNFPKMNIEIWDDNRIKIYDRKSNWWQLVAVLRVKNEQIIVSSWYKTPVYFNICDPNSLEDIILNIQLLLERHLNKEPDPNLELSTDMVQNFYEDLSSKGKDSDMSILEYKRVINTDNIDVTIFID